MMTMLFGLFAAGLIWLAKTIGTKLITRKIDQAFSGKKSENLNFTHAGVTYRYSHYIGQNHVRKGGETRIYEAGVSLTVFNSSTSPRVIRDLMLHCQINDEAYVFSLFDSIEQRWEKNYRIDSQNVMTYHWQASPSGHGLSIWLGAPGIIPFRLNDSIAFYFTYLDEQGHQRRIMVNNVSSYRLPKEQIAEEIL